MILILFLIGFVALMMAIGLACAEKAPVGYEDETGFHFGSLNGPNAISGVRLIPSEEFSDQPENEKLVPLFPLQIPWLHRGVGIAALFIGLLVLLPERFQNVETSTGPNENVQMEELASENKASVAAAIQIQPSKLMQGLCLRFSQAE